LTTFIVDPSFASLQSERNVYVHFS